VSRPAIAESLAVLWMAGLSAVQWFVTSPGRITGGEFRIIALAAVPALVVVLSARWVDNGRRDPW
jgi:hypothetical protein